MFILLVVLVIARDVQGARSWIEIGSFKLQPSEFAKFATNMALAKYLSSLGIRMEDMKTKVTVGINYSVYRWRWFCCRTIPDLRLVFISFIFVLYRERSYRKTCLIFGFLAGVLFVLALMVPNTILLGVIGGLGLIAYLLMRKTRKNLFVILTIISMYSARALFSVWTMLSIKLLQQHQRERIEVLLGKKIGPERSRL
jgi:rod shape determining protein RodA